MSDKRSGMENQSQVKPTVRDLRRATSGTCAAQVCELGLPKYIFLGCPSTPNLRRASPEIIRSSEDKNILSRLERRDFKVFFSISLLFPFNFKVALYYKHETINSNLIVFHDTKQDKDIKY
jgi:hypothetical protein